MTQDNGTSDVRNSARAQGVESGAVDGLGVALCSPGSPSAADGLRGAQRGAERVSDAEEAEWARLADERYADLERLRGECRAVHPTNSTVVPCCLAAGHPEAEHMSTTGCAGSVMHWPTAEAELADARETIARLNARAQVAEAAIAELTGTGKGKAKRVAREIWTRCEESHGLACGTTRRARDFAARVEAENALLSEGVERLSSKIYKLRREAMDDLMALDRVLYAKACELFDNPKEAE